MEAGTLDRRIIIQRAQITTDASGGEVETWLPHLAVWASVEPILDGERWRAAEIAAHVTTRFVIRWGAGVTVEDQVVYEGRVYDIEAIKEIGRREGQEITAAARAE